MFDARIAERHRNLFCFAIGAIVLDDEFEVAARLYGKRRESGLQGVGTRESRHDKIKGISSQLRKSTRCNLRCNAGRARRRSNFIEVIGIHDDNRSDLHFSRLRAAAKSAIAASERPRAIYHRTRRR